MSSIIEEIAIFAKIFEKRMYSPRDVTHISIENVYFPINLNDMANINWQRKPEMSKSK